MLTQIRIKEQSNLKEVKIGLHCLAFNFIVMEHFAMKIMDPIWIKIIELSQYILQIVEFVKIYITFRIGWEYL